MPMGFLRRRGLLAGLAVLVVVVVAGRFVLGDDGDAVETVEVRQGDYADILEIRGQIQPVKSTLVTAPYNAGELQIIRIARNGTMVEAGDVVAEFDAVNLRRTIQEKQGELRTATAEVEQGDAQARITLEERQAAVHRAEFDVQRATLSLGEIGLVSEIEAERARLALADAEQRLAEAGAALASAQATADEDRRSRERKVEKVRAELALAQQQVSALQVVAPTDGTVSIQPNYRSMSPLGEPQEFRAGDRAYPGANILELPDLSTVFLTARIDEADRGQLREGQTATIRVDAVPDRDYEAEVSQISLLARVDFTGGWPPPKQFDLTMSITDPDDRLRPGMSAAARVVVGRLPDVLLVPAGAVQYEAGETVVYRHTRHGFETVPIQVLRRGRDEAAVAGDLSPGDRVAPTRPGEPEGEAAP